MTRPANRPKAAPGLFPAGSCGCIRTRASSEARRRGGASAAAGQAALPWGSPSKEPQEAAQGVAGAAHGAQTVCGTSSSARVIEARLMRLARCVGGDCTPQARADGRRPDCAPGARPRRRRILQLLDQVDPARAGQRRRRSRASSWSSWTSTRLRTRCGRGAGGSCSCSGWSTRWIWSDLASAGGISTKGQNTNRNTNTNRTGQRDTCPRSRLGCVPIPCGNRHARLRG
jgi:hypothetical protein